MGFFDRFSKTFRGKKDADAESSGQTRSYSTLSIFSTPEVNSASLSPTEFERSISDGGVAVAEMTDQHRSGSSPSRRCH